MKSSLVAMTVSQMLWVCVALLLLGTLGAVAQDRSLVKTHEEVVMEQNAVLLSRLAQVSASLASCEANGPTSVQLQKQAQDAAQALAALYAARGVMLKPDGTLGDLPKAEKKP